MTPDWRAFVRGRIPPLELEHEPEILDELAQHLSDLYREALASGRSEEEALAVAAAALPAERERLAREIVTARRSLPGRITDRWTTESQAATPPSRPRWRLWTDFRRDVLYALRTLRRSPGYTLVALLTLAIGIGANTAIFAAVDTVLLRPMPYAAQDRLMVPVSINTARGSDGGSVSYGDYEDWSRETGIFEAVSLWRPLTVDMVGAGTPERITAGQVSPEYFRVITTTPVAGRTFIPADHDPKADRVTVISHALWQRTFGAADVLGRVIRIGGTPHEIIGVLPPRVIWPDDAALFVPMRTALFDADTRTRRDNMVFFSIARLREGVSIEQGNAALAVIASRVANQFPGARKDWTNELRPLREYLVSPEIRRALWMLCAAVGAVLLIGCANLAHLGLVRGLNRQRELSVRFALGAGKWRVVRQLGVESLLLATAGGLGGVALAAWIVRGLRVIAPPDTPFIGELGLDARILLVTAAVTMLSVLIAGLMPALLTARMPVGTALKDGSPSAGASRRIRLLRRGLIVAEVAGAVVLLVGASLLLRSFWRVQHINPGFDMDRVIAARIVLPRAERYETSEQAATFFQSLVDRLSAAPGVQSAGGTSFVPVGGGGFGLGRVFLLEGWANRRPDPKSRRSGTSSRPSISARWGFRY